MKNILGKLGYGGLFAVVIPWLLWEWACALEGTLPRLPLPDLRWAGAAAAVFGGAAVVLGMADLWRYARGLPMNAYPPQSFVSRGIFGYLPHPIYFGFWVLCMGVFLYAGKAAGVWVVGPVVLLGIWAILFGYELHFLERRFGKDRPRARLSLPPPDRRRRTGWDAASAYLYVLIPWTLLYLAFEFFGTPAGAVQIGFGFERDIPVIQWAEGIYALAYPLAMAAPFLLRTRRQVRRFMIAAWAANALGFFLFFTLPFVFEERPFEPSGFWGQLILLERTGNLSATAFPSMHVSWAFICAYFLGIGRGRFVKCALWALAGAIALSCIAVGIHCIWDVLAGALLGCVGIFCRRIWRGCVAFAQKRADSFRYWKIGKFRIINHGLWAGLSAFAGTLLIGGIVGGEHAYFIPVFALAAVAGAGMWGQWLEGSSRLSRPFGFYGGLFGAAAAAALWGWGAGSFWLFAQAVALAGPLIQLIGRVRCLVQGCCHGAPCRGAGIRYRHPQSRPVKLANLSGVRIYPTQLFSIFGNFFLFIFLMRLWAMGAPAAFIAGMYLVLGSLQRFVEEAYRGEPQTKVVANLRIYQWICIPLFAAGAWLTALDSPVLPVAFEIDWKTGVFSLLCGGAAFVAMGCDWPESRRRFTRLT